MVQEVRSILFADEECRQAVASFLATRVRGGMPVDRILTVEFGARAQETRVTLRGAKEAHTLDADEMMSAVLMFCREARIPLASRSQKRLSLVGGKLALTTSINLKMAPPTVVDGTVVHVESGPDLSLLHTT